ncbi:hypothetical protein ACFQV2_27750 [Actinokineospora soli]|uniref:Uncharacterized protein n=1 Tax=Actinokineospora soli TaxID=1048753 RepID=A0ABW2TUM2_9PSEU
MEVDLADARRHGGVRDPEGAGGLGEPVPGACGDPRARVADAAHHHARAQLADRGEAGVAVGARDVHLAVEAEHDAHLDLSDVDSRARHRSPWQPIPEPDHEPNV